MKQRMLDGIRRSVTIGGTVLIAASVSSQSAYARQLYTVKQDTPQEQTKKTEPNTGLNRRITVSLKNVTLGEALAFVDKEANLNLVYSESLLPLGRKVSVSMVNVSARTVLQEVLQGTGVVIRLSEKGRVVLTTESAREQQGGTITGRVTDSSSSKGLAGVTVTVRGANIAKTTNSNGEFTLNGVPAGEQTIEFKLVGYRAFSRTVRANDGETVTVNAVLRTAPTMLSEVVTTAIGQQQRRDVGYTIASINVDSVRRVAPIKSTTDLFDNRIPGVTMQRSSGTPGDPPRIRLRGASSMGENNDPVIIVDGARRYGSQSDERNVISNGVRQYATTSPLDQIDPASIERIDILKGPAAAAMYGPDGASGAIVITTKRGRVGPPQWALDLQAGMSEFPGSWPTGTFQWVTPVEGGLPALCIGFCDQDVIDSVRKFQALNDPYITPLGRGAMFNPSVTLSGGSGNMDYFITASSLRDRGILKLPKIEEDRYVRYQERPVPGWMRRPDLLERNSIRANMRVPLNTSGTTKLSLNGSLTQEVQRRTSMTPSQGAQTAIGSLQSLWVDRSQLAQMPLIGNPYERVTSPTQTVENSITITAQPLSWLSGQVMADMSSSTRNSQQVLQAGVMPKDDNAFNDESGGRFSAQSASSSNSTLSLKLWTPIIRRIKTNAGFDYNRERTDDQSGSFIGVRPGVSDPSQPQRQDSSRANFTRRSSESIFFGYYLVPHLVLSDRLNLSPGFRLDQNGLSGDNGKLIGWPSLNSSWIVSEEPFFPWKGFVSEFRLRGGFGIAGTQPTTGDLNRLYGALVRNPITTGAEPLYGDMWQLYNLGNTRLRPERVREFDMGVDLSIWDNRIDLSFTHARKFTTDAISSQSIAASVSGITSIRTNVGDLQNQTTEVTLNAMPIERENVALSFNINFTHNQSLVKRLARNVGPTSLRNIVESTRGNVSYVPGYPIEGIWMKPIRGYNDLDGNGWISTSEFVIGQTPIYVGSSEPAYQMSVYPTVKLFRNITLSAGIAHVSGQTQQVSLNTSTSSLDIGSPYESNLVFGPEGFNRQVAYLAVSNAPGTGIGYVQKLDVTRLQYVSVGTTVSPRLARLVSARTMEVSLRGSNLALWTNYIGVDPNVNSNTSNAGLYDSGQLPQPREWSLNFSLRF